MASCIQLWGYDVWPERHGGFYLGSHISMEVGCLWAMHCAFLVLVKEAQVVEISQALHHDVPHNHSWFCRVKAQKPQCTCLCVTHWLHKWLQCCISVKYILSGTNIRLHIHIPFFVEWYQMNAWLHFLVGFVRVAMFKSAMKGKPLTAIVATYCCRQLAYTNSPCFFFIIQHVPSGMLLHWSLKVSS